MVATQAAAYNLTCTPWTLADGSSGSKESFVLLQDGTGFKMPRGNSFQKIEFVSEDLPYRKMYKTNYGGLKAVFHWQYTAARDQVCERVGTINKL